MKEHEDTIFEWLRILNVGHATFKEKKEYVEDWVGKVEIVPRDDSTANVITSELKVGGYFESGHMPILDIDFPAAVIPSSTPGHFHLYMLKTMTWREYLFLLWALKTVGIIQEGYFAASVKRGFTCLRLPWIKKAPKEPFKF